MVCVENRFPPSRERQAKDGNPIAKLNSLLLHYSVNLLTINPKQEEIPMFFFKALISALFLIFCNIACAEPHEQTASPWYLDTGIRYWLGEAKFTWNLYDMVGDELLSRLTYQDVTTNTAEGFWKLRHEGGVFFKGYVGGGSNLDGTFIDEDFPPTTIPYSQTQSDQKYGRLNYLSFDLGYDLYQQTHYKISPFIGYHYWFTHYNGLGCHQTGDNPDICGASFFTDKTDTLNDNAAWHSLRLGINGEIQLLDNLNFSIDAAYTYAYLLGHDFHNLRPDIRGEFFEGTGDGVQLDMAFNWLATPSLSMGLGARWWNIKTTGYSHFEETSVQGRPQYIDTTQNNYGLLVQSQYQFDNRQKSFKYLDKDGLTKTPHPWEGFFLGANLGYGMHFNNVAVRPYASTSEAIASFSPGLIHLQSSGFLGGGQVGYHQRYHGLLWGIEADMDDTSIAGTNSISLTPFPYLINHSVTQQLDWFGTVRGKLGKVVSDSLLPYVTAGFSYARTELIYAADVSSAFSETPELQSAHSRKETNLSWVAGAGLEYAVGDHFRYKLEYLYLDLAEPKLDSTYYALSSNFASNLLRLGINYRV